MLARINPAAERRFYATMMLVIIASFVLGFWKSVLFRRLHPEVVASTAQEPYFYWLHGLIMFSWIALFAIQVGLIFARKPGTHRTFGLAAYVIIPVLCVSSIYGAAIAYHRPGGVTGLPLEQQLSFTGTVISIVLIFALYSGTALTLRRNPQAHKRLMLLACLVLTEAAVTRWPVDYLMNGGLAASARITALFMLPLIGWDLWSRHRLHPATLFGVGGYVAYILARPALFGSGPFLSLLGSLLGTPGQPPAPH